VELADCALRLSWPTPFARLLVAEGREAVTVAGADAPGGGLAAKASPGVGVDVSCPPNARPIAD
jgi:hypothetical protein